MAKIKSHKVNELPAQCEADAIYFVNDGNFLLEYVTDENGAPILVSAQGVNKTINVLATRNFLKSDNDAIHDVQATATYKLMATLPATFSVNVKCIDNYTFTVIPDTGVVMKDKEGAVQTTLSITQGESLLIWRRVNGDFIVEI